MDGEETLVLELDDLLRFVVDREATDLHLKVDSPPFVRIHGALEPTSHDPITPEDTEAIARAIVPATLANDLETACEIDFAYSVACLGRFRVSMFRQRGSIGLALRRIAPGSRSLEELGLPPAASDLADATSGLVLVVGPARSGRTTTLAAMVDQINTKHRKHIITIEDPVEVLHPDRQSIVNQREVGIDTESYAEALRRAMRQDPDVILVGVIEDAETARAAVAAAGAGQLVLAAMSTLTPASTVKTFVDHFPSHLEHHARAMLAMCLRGIVSQRLLTRADGEGRTLASEILVATQPVSDAISQGDEMEMFPRVLTEGEYWGMQSFDSSLLALFAAGLVAKRDVIANANEPSDVRIALERIQRQQHLEDAVEEPLLSDRRMESA